MFIYIDESGTFAHPNNGGHSYACAGALTIPGRFHGQILKSFSDLKNRWGCSEVKGRDLTEEQVTSVVDVLLAGKARLHVCATDMLYNTPDAIAARKRQQADRLIANITHEHKPKLVQQLRDCQDKMNSLSDQLFVQMCVMTVLVNKHLQDAVIHYALSDPPELGEFCWIVDRKDRAKTTYEELWHTLLSPFIQGSQFSHSFDDRIVCLTEGDYSHFEKFCDRIDKWPAHLPPRKQEKDGKPVDTINLGKILRESFTLGDSAMYPGLQLADIVINAFRRAICGRLQYDGWKDLGRLMFSWGDEAVQFVHFGERTPDSIPLEEPIPASVITEMTRVAGKPLEG